MEICLKYFNTLILILLLGCSTEPQDCAGVAGGIAEKDNCDVCDNDATNDCEEFIDEIQPPETIITTVETLFESSSVSLNWVGNDYAISFSYRLEPLSYSDTVKTYTNWTEWDTTTVVNFENLDDGFYDFYIRGRFTTDIIEDPIILTFEVDAVSGTALRVYPLYQQVKKGESCDFYIYVDHKLQHSIFQVINLFHLYCKLN